MNLEKLKITGGKKLQGNVDISGAKNAALPELAAMLLCEDESVFYNVPDVKDIEIMLRALRSLGGEGILSKNTLRFNTAGVNGSDIPDNITETSRASILILGPLLAKRGHAKVSLPGGCNIGDRNFNYHIDGLTKMGAEINVSSNHIIAKAGKLKAIDYTFPQKSVTGTENLLMAATLAKGTTCLRNCALEPEITDLTELLIKMGSSISGAGTETLIIEGRDTLSGTSHRIIPDRIETGTYMILGALGENDITVNNVEKEYIQALLDVFDSTGIKYVFKGRNLTVQSGCEMKPCKIETAAFPLFPTDLQAQLTTLMTQINGRSCITENIFNNRFKHTTELNKMGADISVSGHIAEIKGKTDLRGANIIASDLRASAALVLAALIAEGETEISNVYQLLRGYEKMPEKIKNLGGEITFLGS